jgi:dTDP-4-dehydrorhamnose reductase
LGSFLKERLKVPDELFYTGELEALDEGLISRLGPDVVVNTVGKTDLRWCEDNAVEAFRCNVRAPLGLFRRLPEGVLFVHVSSGCVWDGPFNELGEPFCPTSPVNPACFYSWSKASCDGLLLQECCDQRLCILRPRQVYSPLVSRRNTLCKLLSYPRLIDTPNSMTSAETIARTILAVCGHGGRGFRGGAIVNVYDRGVTSPFKVGVLLAEAGLREMPVLMSKGELDIELVPKRVDTVLYDGMFEDYVSPPEVEGELRRVIGEFKDRVNKK